MFFKNLAPVWNPLKTIRGNKGKRENDEDVKRKLKKNENVNGENDKEMKEEDKKKNLKIMFGFAVSNQMVALNAKINVWISLITVHFIGAHTQMAEAVV